MSPRVEVYVDHIRGLIAIEFPDEAGVYVVDQRLLARNSAPRYVVPGGMTRLVDPTPDEPAQPADDLEAPTARAVVEGCATQRYHHQAEGA